jgi:hypothetical protein
MRCKHSQRRSAAGGQARANFTAGRRRRTGASAKGKKVANILNRSLASFLLLACLFCSSVGAQQSPTPEQFTSDFDYLWSSLRDNYAYFGKKETDWDKVRELYRPRLADVRSKGDFVTLLERVLDELYDNHTSLGTNLSSTLSIYAA